MMQPNKPLWRRVANRFLAQLASVTPGATSLRPRLHRWRGMTIGCDVFIGDGAYLENEFPELISIGHHSALGPRVMLIAHVGRTDKKEGPLSGRLIIENNVFIGAGATIVVPPETTVTIGNGAVIGAGSVINHNVRPGAVMLPAETREVATAGIAFTSARSYQVFLSGLIPHGCPPRKGRNG